MQTPTSSPAKEDCPAGAVAVLPPQYFGPVGYYALMARFPRVIVDLTLPYDKRFKSIHRFTIAGNKGPLTLTVPVSRPDNIPAGQRLRWSDMLVSPHDRWWEKHVTALESSYGRTPFFEFYIDRFAPLLAASVGSPVVDLDCALDSIVRRIVCPACEVSFHRDPSEELPREAVDFRKADFSLYTPGREYYQVRAASLGFLKGMSVLDLVFNEGPQSELILDPFTSI